MGARFRSWWQKIIEHPYVTGIVVLLVLLFLLFIFLAYGFGWGWTGFNSGTSQITITSTSKGNYTATISQPSKSLWDWLQLLGVLAIPVVVGFGAVWFTVRHNHDIEIARSQHENDQRITLDNQRETTLQTYLDKMSELILHEDLHNAEIGDKVWSIARARTLTALSKLDPNRKRSLILFLWESDLITINDEKIDMGWADLREADLSQLKLQEVSLEGAYLERANLSEADLKHSSLKYINLQDANLYKADLSNAELTEANLRGADLRWADLREADFLEDDPFEGANLVDADLRGANLQGAKITSKQLKQARSLKGATMPDGSIHP